MVGQIGRHGAPKPSPVERNFGERCQGDPANDRHERAQHRQGRNLAEEEGGEDDGEEGLGGLDCVGEGDGDLAQAHVGEHRAQHVPQGQRCDLAQLRSGEPGRRVEPGRPHEEDEQGAEGELEGGDGVWQRQRQRAENLQWQTTLITDLEFLIDREDERRGFDS